MSIFQCRECGCVENTACCSYWSRKMDGKPLLCSACDPDIKRWHGLFARRSAVGKLFWPHALFAHSMIHGGFVLLITNSIWFALAEVAIHAGTDWLKCEGCITLNTDQAIHIACKLIWAAGATILM